MIKYHVVNNIFQILSTGNCLIHSYGFWTDEDCTNSFDVICEESQTSDVTTVSCPICTNRYIIRDRCFHISNSMANYEDAKKDCISKGGRLFEPKNRNANFVMYKKVKKHANIPYWIGINDNHNPGK